MRINEPRKVREEKELKSGKKKKVKEKVWEYEGIEENRRWERQRRRA